MWVWGGRGGACTGSRCVLCRGARFAVHRSTHTAPQHHQCLEMVGHSPPTSNAARGSLKFSCGASAGAALVDACWEEARRSSSTCCTCSAAACCTVRAAGAVARSLAGSSCCQRPASASGSRRSHPAADNMLARFRAGSPMSGCWELGGTDYATGLLPHCRVVGPQALSRPPACNCSIDGFRDLGSLQRGSPPPAPGQSAMGWPRPRQASPDRACSSPSRSRSS